MARKRKAPIPIERRIVSALRKIWYYSELRRQALNGSLVYTAMGAKAKCAACLQLFSPKGEVSVDHIDPVVAVTGRTDWSSFIQRLLYCSPDNLQVLCKRCHKDKTLAERRARRGHVAAK